MHVVFDMDNTLTDEFGQKLRPGITDLIAKLRKDGHKLSVWTSSTRERAILILTILKIKANFQEIVCREDYDHENKNIGKDIRKISGDFLIDDDPKQIEFVKSINCRGFLIKPFRAGRTVDKNELVMLYKQICKRDSIFKQTPPQPAQINIPRKQQS